MLELFRAYAVQLKHKLHKTNMKQQKNKKQLYCLDGSEQSMIPILKASVGDISGGDPRNRFAIEEFSAGTGVSDLTIFNIDERLIKEHNRKNIQPITDNDTLKTFLCISRHTALSFDDISKNMAHISKQSLKRHVSSLVASNAIVEVSEGVFRATLSHLAATTSKEIIAIEAKVSDWRSGLRQAMRYQEYADYSYLAVYEDKISSCLKYSATFEAMGIGLIGVSNSGVRIYMEASISSGLKHEHKILAYERFISIFDKRYESFVARNGFARNYS